MGSSVGKSVIYAETFSRKLAWVWIGMNRECLGSLKEIWKFMALFSLFFLASLGSSPFCLEIDKPLNYDFSHTSIDYLPSFFEFHLKFWICLRNNIYWPTRTPAKLVIIISQVVSVRTSAQKHASALKLANAKTSYYVTWGDLVGHFEVS